MILNTYYRLDTILTFVIDVMLKTIIYIAVVFTYLMYLHFCLHCTCPHFLIYYNKKLLIFLKNYYCETSDCELSYNKSPVFSKQEQHRYSYIFI